MNPLLKKILKTNKDSPKSKFLSLLGKENNIPELEQVFSLDNNTNLFNFYGNIANDTLFTNHYHIALTKKIIKGIKACDNEEQQKKYLDFLSQNGFSLFSHEFQDEKERNITSYYYPVLYGLLLLENSNKPIPVLSNYIIEQLDINSSSLNEKKLLDTVQNIQNENNRFKNASKYSYYKEMLNTIVNDYVWDDISSLPLTYELEPEVIIDKLIYLQKENMTIDSKVYEHLFNSLFCSEDQLNKGLIIENIDLFIKKTDLSIDYINKNIISPFFNFKEGSYLIDIIPQIKEAYPDISIDADYFPQLNKINSLDLLSKYDFTSHVKAHIDCLKLMGVTITTEDFFDLLNKNKMETQNINFLLYIKETLMNDIPNNELLFSLLDQYEKKGNNYLFTNFNVPEFFDIKHFSEEDYKKFTQRLKEIDDSKNNVNYSDRKTFSNFLRIVSVNMIKDECLRLEDPYMQHYKAVQFNPLSYCLNNFIHLSPEPITDYTKKLFEGPLLCDNILLSKNKDINFIDFYLSMQQEFTIDYHFAACVVPFILNIDINPVVKNNESSHSIFDSVLKVANKNLKQNILPSSLKQWIDNNAKYFDSDTIKNKDMGNTAFHAYLSRIILSKVLEAETPKLSTTPKKNRL